MWVSVLYFPPSFLMVIYLHGIQIYDHQHSVTYCKTSSVYILYYKLIIICYVILGALSYSKCVHMIAGLCTSRCDSVACYGHGPLQEFSQELICWFLLAPGGQVVGQCPHKGITCTLRDIG